MKTFKEDFIVMNSITDMLERMSIHNVDYNNAVDISILLLAGHTDMTVIHDKVTIELIGYKSKNLYIPFKVFFNIITLLESLDRKIIYTTDDKLNIEDYLRLENIRSIKERGKYFWSKFNYNYSIYSTRIHDIIEALLMKNVLKTSDMTIHINKDKIFVISEKMSDSRAVMYDDAVDIIGYIIENKPYAIIAI